MTSFIILRNKVTLFLSAGSLTLVTLASACYMRIDSRVGKRVHPSPHNDALRDVPVGRDVPTYRAVHDIPPLSVCLPELETSEPAGIDITSGTPVLVRQRPAEVDVAAVHAALIEGLRKRGVDARPLDHACHYGFLRNGDTHLYLRPVVLHVEKHYGRRKLAEKDHSSYQAHKMAEAEEKGRFRYQATYAVALELSIYRQGGSLVLQSHQAGVARLNEELDDEVLLAMSMDRLLADFLAGRVREVVP